MIPMVDLKTQYELLKSEINEAINEVLSSTNFIQGPNVKQFEKEIANYFSVDSKNVFSVASGTDALHLSLLALSPDPDDEIITTPFSFISSAWPASYTNCKLVFVDIDPHTFNIDLQLLEKAISKKTRAIIPVHLAGMPCNMKKIIDIGKKNDLKIIEDCAHAIGSKIGKKHVGTFGDAGCFSFYPTKNITTIEGGMIITNSKELANKIRLKRNHGITRTLENRYTKGKPWEYDVEEPGYNFRLDEIRSALGKNQIKKIKEFNKKREKSFDYYNSKLNKIPGIIVPKKSKNFTSSYHLYIIRISDSFGISRDELFEKLLQNGIQTSVHYKPLNKFQVCKNKAKKFDSLNKSEKIYEEIISLPFFTNISKNQLDIVIKAIKKIQKSTN